MHSGWQGWHTAESSDRSPPSIRTVLSNTLVRITTAKAQKSAAAFQKCGKVILMEKLPASISKQCSLSTGLCQYNYLYSTDKETCWAQVFQLTALALWADNFRLLTHLISEDEKPCWLARYWEIYPQPGKLTWEGRESHGIRCCWGAWHQIIPPHTQPQLESQSSPTRSKTLREPSGYFTGDCTSALHRTLISSTGVCINR